MKIGVISDTHGDVRAASKAIDILDRLQVSLTIHCGDVGLETMSAFDGRPMHFVCGNMDEPARLREAIVRPEHKFHERLGALKLEGCSVALLHGHDVKLLYHAIHSGHWDLVCRGHTHEFSRTREGRTLVLNPGAISRSDHPSLAVVELPSLEVTEIPL